MLLKWVALGLVVAAITGLVLARVIVNRLRRRPASGPMMKELYALTGDRSVAGIVRFLDRFLPQRMPLSDDYPIPECVDHPVLVLQTDGELMKYLELHDREPYGVYWDDGSGFRQAMAFYTRDGMVILGLAGDFADPAAKMNEVATFLGAKYVRIVDEERPPDTAAEFISQCE